jgi:hypothetical protein
MKIVLMSFAAVCAFAIGTSGRAHARPAPEAQPERALFLDLQKTVDSRARFEWVADAVEIEAAARHTLRSLCHVDPAARARLRAWVTAEITAQGGPAAPRYRNGEDLDDLEDVVRLERVGAILDTMEPRLATQCGFWAQHEADFAGVQTDNRRFVLMLETNGGGQVYLGRSPLTFGGAGAGRLLGGYGLDDRFTLAAGIELGGSSTFPKDEKTGTRSVRAAFLAGVPLLLRYARSTFLWDTDLAVTARAPEDDIEGWQYGFRLMQGFGTSELRIGNLMGYVLATIGYEYVPANVHHETAHILRIGTRLGIDWDP